MQEDSKVFTGDLEFRANRVDVFLFQKDPSQQFLIPGRKPFHRFADQSDALVPEQTGFRAGLAAGHVGLLLGELREACVAPQILENHVAADTADEGAQSLRAGHAAPADAPQNPQKSLLADVFRDVCATPEADSRLDPDQIPEIPGKMIFRGWVARLQPADVFSVE
jgi:hypothetical protein